jgi:O-methyltransferase
MSVSGELVRMGNIMRTIVNALPGWLSNILFMAYRVRNAYFRDGLFTVHSSEFLLEPRFAAAYKASKLADPDSHWDQAWRTYVCCWAADQAKQLDGDFIECGVNTGISSRAVVEYVGFSNLNKTFWLLDTYCGLVEDLLTDNERASSAGSHHNYDDCYEQVKNTFGPFKNVRIVRGIIPDTLVEVLSDKIAYLSIDMNCVGPEIAAAEYFWDRIIPGGIVVLDDYGWAAHKEQKKAFDEFASRKRISILSMPTGQGLIVKQ